MLKSKNLKLTNLLQRFTNSKKRLHVMLENQTNFHSKSGLGFQKKSKNKKSLRKFFKSKPITHYGFINCYYCNQRGHHIKDCQYRNRTYVLRPNEKLLWLPKNINI